MALVAYRDDNTQLGPCFVRRDYSTLRERILQEQDTLDGRIVTEAGEVYGYRISRNNPVSGIYGMEVMVVRFEFSCIDTIHHREQEKYIHMLCEQLRDRLLSQKVYWNVRLPIHIIDLIRCFQQVCPPMFFCGGTTELVHIGDVPEKPDTPWLRNFMADEAYCAEHRERLTQMAYESFKSYQGQYHISPVTSSKAGLVYKNWIDQAFSHFEKNTLIISEMNNVLCGFILLKQTRAAIEGLLAATDSTMRRSGAYKAMSIDIIQMAKSSGRLYVASTQFDNFVSAGTMTSLGMRPFYGVYNYHFDNRGGC